MTKDAERRRSSRRSRAVPVGLAVLALAGVGACGQGKNEPAAIRIGAREIGGGAVAHWARVLDSTGAFQGLGGEQGGASRQHASEVLILATWIDAEAAREHLTPSAHAVRDALSEHEEANGKAEFESTLRAAGETRADVEFELRTDLAASALKGRLAREAGRIGEAEIASFYRRNLHRLFIEPEVRDAELIEGLPSPAAATALVERIGTGSAFSKRALKEALVHNTERGKDPPDIEKVTDAIFAIRPGLVSRPMSLNQRWTVFIVRKVRPPRPKTLEMVRSEIRAQLSALRHRRLSESFEREYRRRWTAATSCSPGYVVPGCAQYGGAKTARGSLFPAE